MTPADPSPSDIVARVRRDYPAHDVAAVHLGLAELGSARLARCALFLAQGSRRRLDEVVALGRTDPRDLIVAAEYDGADQRCRDFTLPFAEGS